MSDQEPEQEKKPLNPMQVMSSVFAAGIIFTLGFIGVMVVIVQLVLKGAGN